LSGIDELIREREHGVGIRLIVAAVRRHGYCFDKKSGFRYCLFGGGAGFGGVLRFELSRVGEARFDGFEKLLDRRRG
jgi:hypothetical protein